MSVPLRPVAWGPADGRDGRDARRPMSFYREWPAPPMLASAAVCTWAGVPGWSRPMRGLPDGCADIVWNGEALLLVAPVAGPVRLALDARTSSIGIRVRPGIAGHVVGRPVGGLPVVTDLARMWADDRAGPEALERATARLLSAAGRSGKGRAVGRGALLRLVADRLSVVGPPDPRVAAAVDHLGRSGATVGGAAECAGMSLRHLRRRLREQAGLGPTDLHRVLRFQRFVRTVDAQAFGPRLALADLAAATGYADQSHLTRECRRLSGSTPRSLVRGRLGGSPARPAAPGDGDRRRRARP